MRPVVRAAPRGATGRNRAGLPLLG